MSITAYRIVELEEHDEEDEDDLKLEEGQMVEYEDGQYGFILDVEEDDFKWYDQDEGEPVTVEVGEKTVYVVGLSEANTGSALFYEEDIDPVDRDEVLGDINPSPEEATEDGSEEENAYARMDDPFDLEEASAELGFALEGREELVSPTDVPGIDRNDAGLQPWPKSWRDANKPARLIAMDAWSSMGASFRGCRRSMRDSMASPNRFCAAFKDAIYGHTYWREGGG